MKTKICVMLLIMATAINFSQTKKVDAGANAKEFKEYIANQDSMTNAMILEKFNREKETLRGKMKDYSYQVCLTDKTIVNRLNVLLSADPDYASLIALYKLYDDMIKEFSKPDTTKAVIKNDFKKKTNRGAQ